MREPAAKIVCAITLALAAWGAPSALGDTTAHTAISAMNGFALWNEPASEWGPQLTAQELNGVVAVRSDAEWADIQPRRPTPIDAGWQWPAYDAWVAALASHGLTWQPIIDYNTVWASAPQDQQAFAAFAEAVAARYGGGGSFWRLHPELPYLPARIFEIWNEENVLGRYYIDPWTYGSLYALARGAIHAVDATASVDVGGLADDGVETPVQYVSLLMGLHPQLKGQIDAFALHAYAASAADSITSVRGFRQALGRDGEPPSVPIDVTEFGWQYRQPEEGWRAQQMQALGLAYSRSDCGVREAAPYDWINPAGAVGDFGLVDPSGTGATLRAAGVAWFGAFAQGSRLGPLGACT